MLTAARCVESYQLESIRNNKLMGVFIVFGLIILFFIVGFSGLLTAVVASDKGHDGNIWFFAGFITGPLGLIAAAGLSDRKLRKYIRQIGEKQDAIQPEKEDKPVPVSGEMFEV